MGRFCCRSPSKIIGLTVYELARRKAMMCALEARARDANKFLDTVDEREEREETNRKRRLQREKARRREEKKEEKSERQSRSREENNSDAARRRSGSVDEEDGGGCAHCSSAVAAECVYLCQKGHLHRDLPGEGCPRCGRKGESQCKSSFMRILRAGSGSGSSTRAGSRASSGQSSLSSTRANSTAKILS